MPWPAPAWHKHRWPAARPPNSTFLDSLQSDDLEIEVVVRKHLLRPDLFRRETLEFLVAFQGTPDHTAERFADLTREHLIFVRIVLERWEFHNPS